MTFPLRARYDPDVDILYLTIRRGPITDSKELDEDIRLEYDQKRAIIGIEITNARKNLARPLSATTAKGIKAAR